MLENFKEIFEQVLILVVMDDALARGMGASQLVSLYMS